MDLGMARQIDEHSREPAGVDRTGTARIARRTTRRAELIALTHTMVSVSL
jgi:hypothetical protein